MAGTQTQTEPSTQQTQQQTEPTTVQQTQQQAEPEVQKIDINAVKAEAVSELLKSLGIDNKDALSEIVTKAKEDENKNKTDLERVTDSLDVAAKELATERQARQVAEAKFTAVELGAKPELVGDLVVIAMSKVTKDKDINAVIAEIKESKNGSVYFVSEEENEPQKGKNTTRKSGGSKSQQQQAQQNEPNKPHTGTMAERLLANRKTVKKTYFN